MLEISTNEMTPSKLHGWSKHECVTELVWKCSQLTSTIIHWPNIHTIQYNGKFSKRLIYENYNILIGFFNYVFKFKYGTFGTF